MGPKNGKAVLWKSNGKHVLRRGSNELCQMQLKVQERNENCELAIGFGKMAFRSLFQVF